jgi:hypothetical protein
MAFGLRIINDDSDLLIDSELVCPTFVQKLEFNTAATVIEAGTGDLHPGYIKRKYETATVSIGVGECIVLWTLPDNGDINVYYNFESSTTYLNNIVLSCSVYADSTGTALTYSLPTAYIFAIDANGISGLTSTGPALRMYNTANPQKKTFDSNFVQLAPYSIPDTFAFSISGTGVKNYGADPVSIGITVPTNPIFLLPSYHALRIKPGPSGSISHEEYLYEAGFKRVGSTLYTRLFIVEYANEDYGWPISQTTFTSGNNNQLSLIIANADLYAAITGGTGGGTNPQYTLSRSVSAVNEPGSFSITLTISNAAVANGTTIPYSVTGIQEADLTSGLITGNFIITNNTGSVDFTVAADILTEGTETFRLDLNIDPYPFITVTINDTSLTPPTYNEVITGPSSVGVNTSFTLNISGGAPNTNWSYDSGFSSGSGTLDGSGAASILVPGSAQPYTGTYTYNFYFTGSGNSRSKVVSAIQVWNESLSISPQTVSLSNYTTISISGGQPNATFNYALLNYGDPPPSSFPDSTILDPSGNYSNYLTGGAITGQIIGDKMLWVYFPYSGNVRSARVNVVANAGTVLNSYCLNYGVSPYTFRQVIADGMGGSNNSDTDYSTSCGYIAPGTLQSSSCLSYGNAPYTLRNVRYNGPDATYGTYNEDINNSPSCGYVPPPPTATWDAVFSNNGSAGQIYCGVNVYLSSPALTTVTFTFSGTVQDNGASFNVPSVTITAGNTAGAGYEYSGFTNGSGPYSSLTLVVSPSSAPYSISPSSTSYPGFLYS